MRIIDVNPVFDRLGAELIAAAVVDSAPHPAIQMVNAWGLWSRPSEPCESEVLPNSPPPENIYVGIAPLDPNRKTIAFLPAQGREGVFLLGG
jgi:hypothetical protein